MLDVESGHARVPPRGRQTGAPAARLPGLLDLDPLALLALAVLVAAGLLNLAAIGSQDLVVHQLVAVAAGVGLLLVARRTEIRTLPWLGRATYGLALAMLVAVFLAGVRAYGARRWLVLGSVVVQPSELAKLGLLLVLADVLGGRFGSRRVLLALGLAAAPIGLTLLQPDLSTSLLLGVVVLTVMLAARVPLRMVVALVTGLAALTPIGLRLLRPYQLQRVHAFLSGSHDAGSGWSLLQSHVAIASGGLFGTAREPVHVLLAEYLPARQTDLAYASLVEEWGLVAGVVTLLAALLLVWRLVAASLVARTRTAALVGAGLAVLIGAEAIVSVAGNLGALPLAGVPFPFLSYGGTAAAAHLVAVGLVLGARRDAIRRRLWRPPRWARRRPRLARSLAVAMAAQLVVLGTLTWRLQASNGPALREFGQSQMTRCQPLWAPRGLVTDRHGAPLAENQATDLVRVTPRLLRREPGGVERLASLIGGDAAALRQQLSGKDAEISLQLAETSPDVGARVDQAGLPGVVVTPSTRRVYPHGSLLGPLLGFVGVASAQDMARRPDLRLGATVGRSGLERQYDTLLRGWDGHQCVYVDPSGLPVASADLVPPAPGGTLRLGLDLGLQREATAGLAAALRGPAGQPPGDEGAAVVMDAHTGDVLAMASLPAYDNGMYGPPADLAAMSRAAHGPGDPMLEHATQVAAPPGSTFKLVVGAADTVFGVIPPAQVIPTGYTFQFGDHTFHGWGPLPPQNLTQAIAWSNDVYFYKLALGLGPDRIHEVSGQVGAGVATGVDLPGENEGFVGTPGEVAKLGEIWYPGANVILGIGQGFVTATPIQVARWTAAVTTGRLVTPHVGAAFGLAGGPGPFTELPRPAPSPLPFAAGLGPLRDGMRMAVTQGTAGGLRSLPQPAGAKTGSAEDPAAPGTGVDAWYTAALPVDDPEVVVTAFVHGGGEGHLTSEPVARAILDYYLAHRADVLATPPSAPPFTPEGW